MSFVLIDDVWADGEDYDVASGEAVKLHLAALSWMNRNTHLPFISAGILRKITPATVRNVKKIVTELLENDWWTVADGGWNLVKGVKHQPTPAEVEAAREKARIRKANQRDREKQPPLPVLSQPMSRRDSHRDTLNGHTVTHAVSHAPHSTPLPTSPKELVVGIDTQLTTVPVGETAPTPTCPKHPEGTADPCGPCKHARVLAENHSKARASMASRMSAEFASFNDHARTQPDCPHGVAGGDILRPVLGTPSCASCRLSLVSA